MSNACARQLYQLCSSRRLNQGDYVAVNGPWDRFGVVMRSTPQPTEQPGAPVEFLNLIRGCAARPGEKAIASF